MKRSIAFILLISTAFLLCGFQQGKILGPIFQKAPAAAGGGTWSKIAECAPGTALSCVFSVNPTQHDTVVIHIGTTTASPSLACQDGAGTPNVYTVSATKGGGATGAVFAYVAYIIDAPATANKTITCTSGLGFTEVFGSQFRDTGGTPVLDNVYGSADPSISNPSTALINTPSFTPAVGGSLGFCGVLPNAGIASAAGGWTIATNSNGATEYQLSMAASANNANFTDTTTSDNYAVNCLVVKP